MIDAHYRLIVLACQKRFFLQIKLNNESLSSRCCVKGETIFKNPSLQDVSFWILGHTNHDFTPGTRQEAVRNALEVSPQPQVWRQI